MTNSVQHGIAAAELYLERMSKPLREKLKVTRFIPEGATSILDVGCADGTITLALAEMFPRIRFFGIDLNSEFISRANVRAEAQGLKNVHFESVYLREVLAREDRYDSVLFISVLHEFFSYGEGISSVLKALADAHELLRPGGDIIIRDMILDEYTKHTGYQVDTIVRKIQSRPGMRPLIEDFERFFGPLTSIYNLNHFLLKYMYTENWDREVREHYVPVTSEQYESICTLLGLETVFRTSYVLPYLKDKWQHDFGLSDDEITGLVSTGFITARK